MFNDYGVFVIDNHLNFLVKKGCGGGVRTVVAGQGWRWPGAPVVRWGVLGKRETSSPSEEVEEALQIGIVIDCNFVFVECPLRFHIPPRDHV